MGPFYRSSRITIILAFLLLNACCESSVAEGTQNPPHFYAEAVVDHFSAASASPPPPSETWTQRYYALPDHFGGPGSPIFLVLGGEGASRGLLYPFVHDVLAAELGAFVLQPEHRFYGASQPVFPDDGTFSSADLRRLCTPEQAMLDAVALVGHIQRELGCSSRRSSPEHCPVVAVGGSYAGFLAAAMRMRYPAVVDAAYSASAPMKFYAQEMEGGEYYDRVTSVAEQAREGCSDAVRRTLDDVAADLADPGRGAGYFREAADRLGICVGTLPEYIGDNIIFRDEVMMVVAVTFANNNMAYYPPGKDTDLYRSCQIFQSGPNNPEKSSVGSSYATLARFFLAAVPPSPSPGECFDLSSQLPSGPNATITSGDWSGVGSGPDGTSWDFQTCSFLIERIGFSEYSMFPTRRWTTEWLEEHCAARFGASPRPTDLAERWGFDDMGSSGASRILFTNGMNDGWSVGGILEEPLSADMPVINFPNGAHHSDLSHIGPSEADTEDIKEGFSAIRDILASWLEDLLCSEGVSMIGSDRAVQDHLNLNLRTGRQVRCK